MDRFVLCLRRAAAAKREDPDHRRVPPRTRPPRGVGQQAPDPARRAARADPRDRDIATEIEAITGDKIANGTARGRATPAPAARSTGHRGPRPKNDVGLAEALVQAAEIGAQLSPQEAAELVLANSYKMSGNQSSVQVASALAKDGRFKRVGRGVYERVK